MEYFARFLFLVRFEIYCQVVQVPQVAQYLVMNDNFFYKFSIFSFSVLVILS